MNKITNTSKTSPKQLLIEAMVLGSSEAIEASERRGGQEMLEATVLPVDGSDSEAVMALGIEWGQVDSDDPIFRKATLPAGWSKAPGDNPYGYWTDLVDENGEVRAGIFYKAAFYDRSARIHAIPLCVSCQHSSDAHTYREEVPYSEQTYPCVKCDCGAMVRDE